MDAKSLKLDLVQKLLSTEDEAVLEAVQKVLEGNKVAHSVSGEPLSKEDYDRKIAEAEQSIKDGKTYTTGQLKDQIKNWKK